MKKKELMLRMNELEAALRCINSRVHELEQCLVINDIKVQPKIEPITSVNCDPDHLKVGGTE